MVNINIKWIFFINFDYSTNESFVFGDIFYFFFFRNSNDDKGAKEFIDENQIELQNDEEYLHSNKKSLSQVRINRLTPGEIACAHQERLKEVQMWSIIREALTYFSFLSLLCIIVYSNQNSNSFLQVKHLQKHFLNYDYTKVCFFLNFIFS